MDVPAIATLFVKSSPAAVGPPLPVTEYAWRIRALYVTVGLASVAWSAMWNRTVKVPSAAEYATESIVAPVICWSSAEFFDGSQSAGRVPVVGVDAGNAGHMPSGSVSVRLMPADDSYSLVRTRSEYVASLPPANVVGETLLATARSIASTVSDAVACCAAVAPPPTAPV